VKIRIFTIGFLLLLASCGGPRPNFGNYGAPTNLTCVPYAREVSGIQLSGDAWEWWGEAAGIYPRAHSPEVGAVLVLAPHGSMTVGHLAVVTALRDARTIEVTQSNWLPRRIEHNQPVIDVSAANDWTAVRVWYEPAQEMGSTVYPAYGFILPR
jgi:surface antigen